ncbi:MAG: WYL domain-containing protein [Bacteroidetes bacterium]|nr:WYL domain-containing protein [Bacteroidota bacterium]
MTNKHAQIRYTILDRCFSNFFREYTYDDLLDEVNSVLNELGTDGIELRQLQYDIAHMKSDAGYSIELAQNLKKDRKKVFRYRDKNFSLADHPLNQNDSEQLETTLAILSRYKHREEFNWLEELIPRMETAFDLVSSGDNGVISYQENRELKGREHLGVLFNFIIKNKVVELEYEPYNKEPEILLVHPYHLKQYNNRWFLICYNEKYKALSNYALDRINCLRETSTAFERSEINWLEYFKNVIGVTKPDDSSPETIKLRFTEKQINYVLTKPLHASQKLEPTDNSGLSILIKVIPNSELYQLLLSFGEDVEVLSPKEIREEMIEKIDKMKNKY